MSYENFLKHEILARKEAVQKRLEENYAKKKEIIARIVDPTPRRMAEIGVHFGFGAAAFLSEHPKMAYHGIDWFKTQTPEAVYQRLLKYFPGASIFLHKHDTKDLEVLPGAPFDFIHVDGEDHVTEMVLNDLRLAYASIKRPGGMILIDDFHYRWVQEGMVKFLNKFANTPDLTESKLVANHVTILGQDCIINGHYEKSPHGDYIIEFT
jgi:predicted O-methyltransferase YrrM